MARKNKNQLDISTHIERWTPAEAGKGAAKTYCSPACGMGCLKSDYTHAMEKALELAHIMGDGWTPKVWENLGWHWGVEKGVTAIYGPMRKRDTYDVYINTSPQFIAHGKEPVETLTGLLVKMKRQINILSKEYSKLGGGHD